MVRLGSDKSEVFWWCWSWDAEESGGAGVDAGRGESPGGSDEEAVLYDARSRGFGRDGGS